MALKILLADDSMTAQNMGKKILVDAGYEVVAVSNGAAAIKKVIAADLQRAMTERKITKSALAKQLATSRAHVDRLLDPRYTPVSLETISRAATFMGKRLHFSLRDAAPKAARRSARRKVAV